MADPEAFTPARRRLTALRLTALGIDSPSAATPDEAVRSAFATQAQDFLGALWSIGLRTPGSTAASVEAAHEAGGFVRSWPMRGTLHFVAADDLGWMLELTGARMLQTAAGRRRQLGLTDSDFERAEAIATSPADRRRAGDPFRPARRVRRRRGLDRRSARGAHPRSAGAARHPGARRPRLLGAARRVGSVAARLERDEALREFAFRYFSGHGSRHGARLRVVVVADAHGRARGPRGRPRAARRARGRRHLVLHAPGPANRPAVPCTCCRVSTSTCLGYSDRDAPLAGMHSTAIVPGGNGVFRSTVVIDGEVVSAWRRERTAKRVVVTLDPFRPIPARRASGHPSGPGPLRASSSSQRSNSIPSS